MADESPKDVTVSIDLVLAMLDLFGSLTNTVLVLARREDERVLSLLAELRDEGDETVVAQLKEELQQIEQGIRKLAGSVEHLQKAMNEGGIG